MTALAEPEQAQTSPSRWAQLVTLALLGGALVVAVAVLIPWTVLPGADLRPDLTGLFTPAERAREVAYHGALRPLTYGSLAVSLGVAALLGLTRLGAALVRAAARLFGGSWFASVVAGTAAVLLVERVARLPLSVRAEAVRREYGLSTSTWGSWSLDVLRAFGVQVVLTVLVLLVVLALARRARRTWWAWAAGATAALVVAGSFAYPLVVEPVFNSFRPLPAGELRSELLALAARDDVPVEDVLVADASRRTSALNAYVSGFGSTRRVVVYDTLLAGAPPAEIRLITAHELGHAKRDDVLAGTLLGALGSAAGVVAVALLVGSAPLRRRAGATSVADPRVIPLVLLLVTVGTLAVTPVTNLLSRRIEARADLHALDLTRDPDTFIAMQRRLSTTNLGDLDPDPLSTALFASHPDVGHRIALAREWERLRG